MFPIKNINDLIPQKFPFVMIDQLDDSDETSTRCSFTIRDENIFTVDGAFREAGLIENIAQTAAARVGFIAMMEKKDVPVGFIGAVKNLEINDLPKTGETIVTEIKITNTVFDVTIISGTVCLGDKIIAQCEMKIVINPELKAS
ncbi:MAG: 3-hydroxyacyl-ACP dehydratase [Bacteroidetes bacterium]|nr:3-hydroxyacyl-ACP dehydratase [Bacteroidota bacterium]MBP6401671.1 3-hydroxyacyl-ACP dehydratase [Bacteroidia bacterium]MBK6839889.1 3-hydroxyacyl-ACP dehydratase [Bacteroidota bacterium]MBK9525173.1 3-hydroxyacyl-ACP dehydratase [Bacteroidota bacterium]MBK9543364.1 3-hydroxyacyl-ACP dehydratase [Bacteroidota bacterium]